MPKYSEEIARLNKEIESLKNQLIVERLKSENYVNSIKQAQSIASSLPLPKDINPILKQIRNKSLTLREKAQIAYPELYPSPPEDIYYQWIAPSRVAIKRDKQWYWNIALLFIFIIFFAVLANQFMMVAVALSFFFAIYVNNSIPPKDIVYKFTKQGIEIGEGDAIEIYSWGQLIEYSYYFKNDTEVIYIETILPSPQRIQILFSSEDRKNVSMILKAHLPYKPPPKKQNWLTRWLDGIYIPLHDFEALQEKIDRFYNQRYAELISELKKEGKIPNDVTVDDLRTVENMSTLKIMNEIQKQQEEEAKKILGIN